MRDFIVDVWNHEGPFWLAFLLLTPVLGGAAFFLWMVGK